MLFMLLTALFFSSSFISRGLASNETDTLDHLCSCRSEQAECSEGKCVCKEGTIDLSPPNVPGLLCKSVSVVTDGCEPGWATVDGSSHCFKVVEKYPVTAHSAGELCSEMNSTLATITTDPEVSYLGMVIPREVQKKSSHKKVWIGLHRKSKTSSWSWQQHTDEPVTFSAFLDVFLKQPDAAPKLCAYAIGSRYGFGRWMEAECNDTSVVGYICSKDREGSFISDEDMVYRQYMITCCQGGTPTLDDDLMKIARGWTATKTGFVNLCETYEGVYQIPKSVYGGSSYRQISVNCKCTGENRDRNCRDARICENSGYRAASENHRCVCVGNYFGELCEKYCQNGRLRKNENLRDYCECGPGFAGDTCNKMLCVHGVDPTPESGNYRACLCEEGYVGRFCDEIKDTSQVGEHHSSGTNLQQALGTTAPTLFFFIILMVLYCLCKRLRYCARIRERVFYVPETPHGARVQTQQLSSISSHPMTHDYPPPFASSLANSYPASMTPIDLKPPPKYEDIFGPTGQTASSGAPQPEADPAVQPPTAQQSSPVASEAAPRTGGTEASKKTGSLTSDGVGSSSNNTVRERDPEPASSANVSDTVL